jgi:tetratricopeptide (TPR) repeat protein
VSIPLEQFPRPTSRTAPKDQRLDSWKEIASYMGREVRTVQRWEKADGLPIRRLLHAKRGSVYAFPAELDAWVASREPNSEVVAGAYPVAADVPTSRGNWAALTVCCAALIFAMGAQRLGTRVLDLPANRTDAVPENAAGAAYLRGLYLLNLLTDEGLTKSIPEFQEAIAKDGRFAPAYARISQAHTFLSFGAQREEELASARDFAQRALRLNKSSAEAHEAVALLDAYGDWNWAGAEAEYKTALQLDPNSATAHSNYAQLEAILGRHDLAVAEARRAWQLQPLSPTMGASLGWFFYWARRFDDAIATSRQVLESQPGFESAQACVVRALVAQGKFSDARTELIGQMQQGSPDVHQAGLDVESPEKAIHNYYSWQLTQLNAMRKQGKAPLFELALAYAAVGAKDSLMDCLQESYQRRQFIAMLINAEPYFDAYRNEPRLIEIARKVGLPASQLKTSAVALSAQP